MYRLASLHVLIAGVLVSATCVFAAIPNLALNPGFSEASTEPGQVAAAWSYTFPDAVSPRAVVSLSTTSGLPAPSLRITSAALAAGGSTTDNGAFQVFPVVPGTKYQVSGQWRGNLSVQPPGGGNHRSTVFCTIEFSADGLTGWTAYGGASRYLKQLDYARIRASTNVPFTMTLQDYTWDWEDITLSPQTGFPAAFDVLAVP
ncbi:MAG TPA: hypothetical protein VLH60_03935, partial [Sedimentisphaerales bacterium]|nr:hypothetical protein [Sedimentisphaerales bacterium]